jgi:hypothetical protein
MTVSRAERPIVSGASRLWLGRSSGGNAAGRELVETAASRLTTAATRTEKLGFWICGASLPTYRRTCRIHRNQSGKIRIFRPKSLRKTSGLGVDLLLELSTHSSSLLRQAMRGNPDLKTSNRIYIRDAKQAKLGTAFDSGVNFSLRNPVSCFLL